MSNPKRRPKESPPKRDMDSGDGIDTIWRSLGRLRAELRKMDHRLDGGVGELSGATGFSSSAFPATTTTTTTTSTATSAPPSGPGGSSSYSQYLHQQQQQHRGSVSGGAVAAAAGGAMPGISPAGRDKSTEAGKLSLSSAKQPGGARRKVSRPDEKGEGSRQQPPSRRPGHHGKSTTSGGNITTASGAANSGSSGGARGREPVRANHNHHNYHHGNSTSSSQQKHAAQQTPPPPSSSLREDSPKRVDFSKTHQLREVNWDGTYQDSLTFPTDLPNTTLTSSRDIRDTNLNFLNFSGVPGGPSARHPPSSPSTSSSHPFSSSASSFRPTSNPSSNTTAAVAGATSASLGSKASLARGSTSSAHKNSNNNARQSSGSSSSSPLCPPPPAVSNSSVNYQGLVLPPATPSSTSVTSGMSQHHQHLTNNDNNAYHHHHHHPGPSSSSSTIDNQQQQQQSDILRAASAVVTSSSSSASLSSPPYTSSNRHASTRNHITPSSSSASISPDRAGRNAKLSSVEVRNTQDARGTSQTHGLPPQPSLSSASQDLAQIRRQVEDKWTFSRNTEQHGAASDPQAQTGGGRSSRTFDLRLRPGEEGGARDVDTATSALLGGAMTNDARELYSPRRARPIKKAITADLKEDEIMLKLKERLKQQRALASSSSASGSNDTSLADTSNSQAPPPALPPRQPLTGDRVSAKPRKVAAAHPASGYRGFSTEPSEQHHTAGGATGTGPSRPNTRVSGGVKKKTSGVGTKRQPQLQLKKPEAENVPGVSVASRHSSPQQEQRPKKVARLIAVPGDKKSSKTGAKNIITTSSWRAGQDLILKELGLPPSQVKVKSKASAATQCQGEGGENDLRSAEAAGDGEDDMDSNPGRGDVTAGGGNISSEDRLMNEMVAKSKILTEDTRHMLKELQLGNVKDGSSKEKSPHRPPKRKAPKPSATTPTDQQQPSEKTRHYDADSVRKFMAKQKAERLKKQQEEKLASEKANQKRQQMMEKLAETQRAKAAAASTVARPLPQEVPNKKRKDGRGTSKGTKKNADMTGEDHDDDSTLTGDSEDELTPRATPKTDRDSPDAMHRMSNVQEQMEFEPLSQNATFTSPSALALGNPAGGQTQPANTTTIEFKGQTLNLDLGNVLSRFSQVVNQRSGSGEAGGSGGVGSTEAFHHSSNHPRGGGDGTPPFDLGTSNAVLRTNEERKQAIKATALTLQNRLMEERRKFKDMKLGPEPKHPHSGAEPEFVPRYERIAGTGDDFTVFNSNLPGSQIGQHSATASKERQDEAAARIQAAYRGHSVRGAFNWSLPSGDTLGNRLRPGSNRKSRERKMTPTAGDEGGKGDGSDLTETSSFSEISATDISAHANPANPADVPGNQRVHHRHQRHSENRFAAPLQPAYQPTVSQAGMPAPRADPQSIMSIFSRQSKYLAAGSARAEVPTAAPRTTTTANTSSGREPNLADLDLTNLKQPVLTQSERVVHGQTPSGQLVVAKARYTRLEATITSPDDKSQDASSSASESAAYEGLVETSAHVHSAGNVRHHSASLRSKEPSSSKMDKMNRQSSHKSGRSEAYSISFESDEDEEGSTLVSGSHQRSHHSAAASAKKSGPASGYNRQVSDAGQETDVSQMSEDEPRMMRSKFENPSSPHHSSKHPHQAENLPTSQATRQTGGAAVGATPSGRLSPNSLANKLSAGLNHLESMEESLRQVVGMERVRAVALAQQETVSLAQILKARQLEHSTEMRQLQAQAQEEAREANAQLEGIKSRPSAAALLKKEDNLRPASRNTSLSVSRSTGYLGSPHEDLSQSPGNRRIKRSSATASLASVTKVSSSRTASIKTAADSSKNNESSDSSIRSLSDADAADSRADATVSVPEEISGAVGGRSRRKRDEDDDDRVDSYSMSFDESVTDEESFRQVLPSESHRKEVKQQEMHNASQSHDVSSSHLTPYGDLSSLFIGDENFNQFTAEMVRQIMKEEEYRAQHQAALLGLREKALREKAKAELAWLQQKKKKPRDKKADDVYPNFEKREQRIRKNFQEQQAEIRRLQEANKMASQERQMLLQQHEEIARIKENTNATLNKLKAESPAKGRLARPSEVHTEDEVEEESEAGENVKDSKSDSEMYRDVSPTKKSKGDKKSLEKQRKLRLDQKYMTAREQKLHERKKQAEELLEWKKRLDAEEAKIYKLERQAMDVWGETAAGKKRKDKEKDKAKKATAAPSKPVPEVSRQSIPAAVAATADDISTAAISEHLASSAMDETIQKEVAKKAGKSSIGPSSAKTRSQTIQGSISEVISTQLSLSQSESDYNKSRSKTSAITSATGATAAASGKGPHTAKQRNQGAASGSESSIPEEVPSASSEEKKKALDSSDDTLINSSANDDYADTFEHDVTSASLANQRKKSPVGRLLPQGNSPLPTPWSRSKTGSESESEDSISHTETMSDASDYEVRIRQLSDELKRRRKEVEILKKERSRRKKEKFKAQEVALKKQLDAYNIYIQQLKEEKDDLEHEPPLKSTVRPQIKQPGAGAGGVVSPAGKGVAGSAPHSLRPAGRHGDDAASNSSSFEDMRDGTDSNQASPSMDQKDVKLSPVDEKAKKKASVSLMDRISEGSESDKSVPSRKGKATGIPTPEKNKASEDRDISERSSSSMQEVIEEASQLDSHLSSEKTHSGALKIKTSGPGSDRSRDAGAGLRSQKDEDLSYSMDFSDSGSTLAQSHSKVAFGSRADRDLSHKDEMVSEAGEVSEHIVAEEPSSVASLAKSPGSVSSQLKFDFKVDSKSTADGNAAVSAAESLGPSTGIQESDSETESRVNSYHTSAKSEGSSRPSSERSVGSLSYSAEDDEEDNEDREDIQQDQDTSSASEKTPVKSAAPEKILPPVGKGKPAAAASSFAKSTEDDISEHLSASLPSISEKQGGSHSNSLPKESQDMLDSLLGYQEGDQREEEDEDDKTPVPTPREMLPLDEDEEENLSLLMTDPLADFNLGERVLIWGGQRLGTLRYKGKVDFSPGIWAGVELDQPDGDHDGMQEGTRYFSCLPRHGVIVQGSDIMSAENDKESKQIHRQRLVSDEGRSLDESLTTEDSKAEEGGVDVGKSESILHSTPLGSPSVKRSVEKPTATPVKPTGDKISTSLLADSISEQLEASLVQESLEAVVGRLTAKSSAAKKAVPPLPSTQPPTQARPEEDWSKGELPDDSMTDKSSPLNKNRNRQAVTDSPPSMQKTDRTADGVMRSLLDEAISDMVTIKRRKAQTLSSHPEHAKLNGDLDHKDKQALLNSRNIDHDEDDDDDDFYTSTDEKAKDNDSGLSLDPVHRPASPIPGDAPTEQDRKELNDELSDLLGEYIDDDLGLMQQSETASKTEQQALERSSLSVPEDIPPVVPQTKDEITPIVSRAVDIFWTTRRYGENLDGVQPPPDFLSEWEDEEMRDSVSGDQLSAQSRRSWKHMLFDLTGEIIRDIYQDESKPDPPVWQKAQHRSHKFFKGSSPPTTVDGLRPLVERAVSGLLDLDGPGSRQGSALVNKWNIRKKKDAVDAVLVSELAQEEKGWVNYDEDELNLKMSLADSLFDTLLSDTVQTLNGIYQRRSTSKV